MTIPALDHRPSTDQVVHRSRKLSHQYSSATLTTHLKWSSRSSRLPAPWATSTPPAGPLQRVRDQSHRYPV